MIGQRYRAKKAAVLTVWKRYKAFRGTAEDGVDATLLELRAKALEEGHYLLAVVGETSAGKSTLINALLGERILPTDILQSSSAIIEIFKSEKKYVEVLYADDHTETVYDDLSTPGNDDATEHLRKIGALQDGFREIPTTLIDEYIVQGRIQPGRPIPIADLHKKSGLPLEKKASLIEEYVKERTCANIPKKITFGFPLKYDFDELRIVDSPGVNALGGLQERTLAYMHKANAVLFVHSVEGSIESSSFRQFISEVVPNRTRQALFLVLSKTGLKSAIEIEEKLTEARSLFSQEFDPHRVLHVDSMLKIVSDDIRRFDSATALKKHYTERWQHFTERYNGDKSGRRQDGREAVNFHMKLRLLNAVLESVGADADRDTVHASLRRSSNFEEMERTIEEFSARAPELQISEILTTVKRGYENQFLALEQEIDLLTKRRKHPQTFENEISEIKRKHEEYQLLLNEFSERVKRKYGGTSYREKLDGLKEVHTAHIGSASSKDGVNKALADFHNANCSFIDEVARTIRNEFETELRRRGKEFEAEHSITMPSVDVGGIEESAKAAAYRNAEVERGPENAGEWFLKIVSFGMATFRKTVSVFDDEQFLSNYKSLTVKALVAAVERNFALLSGLVESFTDKFSHAVKSLIDSLLQALEELRTGKATNKEILAQIANAERKKKDILAELRHINEMVEDLR